MRTSVTSNRSRLEIQPLPMQWAVLKLYQVFLKFYSNISGTNWGFWLLQRLSKVWFSLTDWPSKPSIGPPASKRLSRWYILVMLLCICVLAKRGLLTFHICSKVLLICRRQLQALIKSRDELRGAHCTLHCTVYKTAEKGNMRKYIYLSIYCLLFCITIHANCAIILFQTGQCIKVLSNIALACQSSKQPSFRQHMAVDIMFRADYTGLEHLREV